MYEELKVFRGSTFDCCISLVDMKRNTYLLAEGDKLIFGVRASLGNDKETGVAPADIIRKELTVDDEIGKKYYFSLSPGETEELAEDNFYYVAVEFAEGEKYQIAPFAGFTVVSPLSVSYDRGNEICAQVPRLMHKRMCRSIQQQALDLIRSVYGGNDPTPVRIRSIGGLDIIALSYNAGSRVSPDVLVRMIGRKAELFDSENYIVIGMLFSDEEQDFVWQREYKKALINAYGNNYMDIESILKEPVYSQEGDIIGSYALEKAGITPSEEDIRLISLFRYPAGILECKGKFNETGLGVIAGIIKEEAEKYE